MLDPRDIQAKKFKETRLVTGYNMDDVDEFLDEVVDTVTELRRQVADLSNRVAVAQSATPAPGASLVGAEKILVVAQQTADQAVADANHQASTLVAEATAQANSIVGKAYVEAGRVKDEANAQAQAMLAKATSDRDEIHAHKRQLESARDEVAARLRAALDSVTPPPASAPPVVVIPPQPSEMPTIVIPKQVESGTDIGTDDEGAS